MSGFLASSTSSVAALHTSGNTQTIQLPDGRKFGVLHSGDLNGKPLFFFPGFGVSRLTAHPNPTIAQLLGVHIVTVDRPGIGLSDCQPRGTLLDWPDDVQALADTLGMARFAVLGWSAGGPHALACAYKIPDRLTAVGIASSAPPFHDRSVIRTMPATVARIAVGRASIFLATRPENLSKFAAVLEQVRCRIGSPRSGGGN